MLFVDGQASGAFWAQSVALAASTTYVFKFFVTGADSSNPAQIQLSASGTAVNYGVLVSAVGPDWQEVTVSFTPGATAAYDLSLRDVTGQSTGNDFTVDDISMRRIDKVARADNLLANGDFSKGTKHFTSDYQYTPPDGSHQTQVSQYSVVTNPASAFTNGYDSYVDHTNGLGNMLFVDGNNSGSFWKETVNLAADTTYSFRYFVTGADSSSLPVISFAVNGAIVDVGYIVTHHGGTWQEVVESFTTGAAGGYALALADLNGSAPGNDFTIDDLSLTGPATGGPGHAGAHEHAHGHAHAEDGHDVAAVSAAYDHFVI